MRAQKDLRRLAFLEPGLSLLGFVVTAVCSLEPGFSRRYDSTPFLFKPPSGFLPSLRCHAGDASSKKSKNRFMGGSSKDKSGISAARIYEFAVLGLGGQLLCATHDMFSTMTVLLFSRTACSRASRIEKSSRGRA